MATGIQPFGPLISTSLSSLGAIAPIQSSLPHNIPRQTASEACRLPATDVYLSSGFNPAGEYVPTTGTLNAAMIFVDFPDAPAAAGELASDLYAEFFLPGAADWYAQSSFDQLSLSVAAETSRFFRMPAPSTDYGFQRGLSAEDHAVYIRDALDAVGMEVGFAGAELLYVGVPRAAAGIAYSPTYMSAVTAGDGTRFVKVVTFGVDVYNGFGFRTVNHETGHAMGLPDLYAFGGGVEHRFVGGFDIMGWISGVSPDYLAWHKWKLGWLADDQFDCVTAAGSTEHVLTPVEVRGGSKAVVVRQTDMMALVAEVRTQQGVNSGSNGSGVLIYTVRTDVPTGEGPIVVHDTTPGDGNLDRDRVPLFAPESGRDTFVSQEMGTTVTVVRQEGDGYVVRVDRNWTVHSRYII